MGLLERFQRPCQERGLGVVDLPVVKMGEARSSCGQSLDPFLHLPKTSRYEDASNRNASCVVEELLRCVDEKACR